MEVADYTSSLLGPMISSEALALPSGVGSCSTGSILVRMVRAVLVSGLCDRLEHLLDGGAFGVGGPLEVLVGDVHPGLAHIVMGAHASAVENIGQSLRQEWITREFVS